MRDTKRQGFTELDRLRRANEVLESTFEGIHVLLAYMDREFNFIRVNRNYARADCKEPPFFVGKNHFDLYPNDENEAIFRRVVETGEPHFAYEKAFTYPDRPGEVTWWDWTLQPIRDENGEVENVLLSLINVTARVLAHKRAEEKEAQFAALFQQADDTLIISDIETGMFIEANATACRLFDCDPANLGAYRLIDFAAAEDRQALADSLARAASKGHARFQTRLETPGKDRVAMSVTAQTISIGGRGALMCVCHDVTAQQEAAWRLARTNRALATLRNCNQALVRAGTEEALFATMSRCLTSAGDFTAAGILMADADGRFQLVATGGDAALLPSLDEDTGGAPLSQLVEDASHWDEPRMFCRLAPARPMAVMPLRLGKQPLGALVLTAADCELLDEEEMGLLVELAGDISFGIATIRTRVAQELGEKRLERSFEATIQAISTAVEIRDPYTAGHQRRVADLATRIARRMGMSDYEIIGIRMAGLVHDIGKISVPAEILNRPGQLTAPEFEIIKSHSSFGYDILKGVEMPWPVAEMVLQHHERLDGSGYPQGISGDAINIGARILAVADVVEAIFSHRPYRPGRGIEMALDEIEKNAGRLYDPQVVAACLALFREDGFTFET